MCDLPPQGLGLGAGAKEPSLSFFLEALGSVIVIRSSSAVLPSAVISSKARSSRGGMRV